MPFINLNELNYYYDDVGSGDMLLLLHGFTGSLANWQPFMGEFSAHFRVIALDFPGHGQTDSPEQASRYAMDQIAADIVLLLDKLDILQCHMLGYSMGGRLALYFAVHYTNRLKSLILESSSPGLKTEHERRERKTSDDALADRIEREGIEAFVTFWENIPLFASQKNLPSAVRDWLRAQRLQNNPLGLANSLRGMGTGVQPSLWDSLSEIGVPALLIVGELDSKFRKIASKMPDELPNSHVQVVQNAGHTVHLEQPVEFSRIILDFLDVATT